MKNNAQIETTVNRMLTAIGAKQSNVRSGKGILGRPALESGTKTTDNSRVERVRGPEGQRLDSSFPRLTGTERFSYNWAERPATRNSRFKGARPVTD